MDEAATGMAGLLDEGALWLPPDAGARRSAAPVGGGGADAVRARFLPGSAFARDFGLPPGCAGEVRDRWVRDGREVLGVMVEGWGYLSGVPAEEVEAVSRPDVLP